MINNNELMVQGTNNEVKTIDSREVAEMMEVNHKDLLKKIDNINNDFGGVKVRHEKYWIESTFENRGKQYRKFEVTKRGCEFLAHKTTGTKGNLFTDKYMDKFEMMETALKQQSSLANDYMLMSEEDRAIAYFTKMKEMKQLKAENEKKDELLLIASEKTVIVDNFLDTNELYGIDVVAKVLGIKGLGRNNFYKYLRDNKILMTDVYADTKGRNQGGSKHYEAYSQYCNQQQYFTHRTRTVNDIKQNVAMFTPKGIEWIIKKLQKDEYIPTKSIEEIFRELESNKKDITA